MNIQYAVLETTSGGHELVEKMYFARAGKGTMSRSDFEAWSRAAAQIRDEALLRYERAGTEKERQAIVHEIHDKLSLP